MATETRNTPAERPGESPLVMAASGRTVLVATDDTPASAPALRVALALDDGGAAVHALHVVDTR